MVSWSAYAPRRAPDPRAWLTAKGITSQEGLESALREVGVDPATFPQDIAALHLGSLVPPPQEIHIERTEVDPAAGSALPAAPRRGSKKLMSSS